MSITTTVTAAASSSLVVNPDQTVSTTFNYWGTSALPDVSEIGPVFAGKSSKLRTVPTTVTDIRPLGLSSFNLDQHGFQVLLSSSALLPPQSTCIPDFHDSKVMRSTYWPELVTMLKDQLGVRAAVAINTTVRDVTDPQPLNADNPRANPKQSFHPFFVVHGDYTPAGARGHMRAMKRSFFEDNDLIDSTREEDREEFLRLRDEIVAAEEKGMEQEGVDSQWEWSGKNYQGPRWAMLSVWRPLETVHRDPLAVMDPRSFFKHGKRPYVDFERVYKDRPGFEKEYRSQNMMPIAPESEDGDEVYKWYYVSEQTPEEVYALKLFDSEAHRAGSRTAECVAHSAFSLPHQENEELRRSAEVRMMVVW